MRSRPPIIRLSILLLLVFLTLTPPAAADLLSPDPILKESSNSENEERGYGSLGGVNEVQYTGPSYEGCCPQDGTSDVLECCQSGGCCPSLDPSGDVGHFLHCCVKRAGTLEAGPYTRSLQSST
jgi:hypothetical protein